MENRQKVFVVSTNFSPSSQEEIQGLVEADGGEVLETIYQKLDAPLPAYLGKGKIEEIKILARELEPDLLVVNDSLKGSQLRNLEKALDLQVIDRTHLILDIFATRARTRQAKLQVRLAQLRYGKSRLIGSYSLSKAGGGIGTRGPGEQKLELDRRKIDGDIHSIENQLKKIKVQRREQLKRRDQSSLPIVSLVGYTNAGKSSMMNALLGEKKDKAVEVKDMVFATLDTSLRSVKLLDQREVILADTVGFITDLPDLLMEAFTSTLEELKASDLLVHVLDGTSPRIQEEYRDTLEILKKLDLLTIPRLTVVNKMDTEDIPRPHLYPLAKDVLYYSVKEGPLELLEEKILEGLKDQWTQGSLHFSFEDQSTVSKILEKYPKAQVTYDETGCLVTGSFLKKDYRAYEKEGL